MQASGNVYLHLLSLLPEGQCSDQDQCGTILHWGAAAAHAHNKGLCPKDGCHPADGSAKRATMCEATMCEATVCEATVCGATVCEATVCEATVCEATVCGATVCEATVCEATACEATVCEATVCEATVLTCAQDLNVFIFHGCTLIGFYSGQISHLLDVAQRRAHACAKIFKNVQFKSNPFTLSDV